MMDGGGCGYEWWVWIVGVGGGCGWLDWVWIVVVGVDGWSGW